MRITGSQVAMASSYASVTRTEVQESLRVSRARPAPPPQAQARTDTFEPSGARRADGACSCEAEDKVEDPKLRVLIGLIERLTGRQVELLDAGELQHHEGDGGRAAARPSGPVIQYDRVEETAHAEKLQFAAQATVTTEDGRQIDVAVQLSMARAFVERSETHVRIGQQAVDPLVLDLGGAPGSVGDRKVAFDIDADGTLEQVPWVDGGAAFLALDRNGNGSIDDGSELFGPTSGSGFGELAALDDDGNGWIDEGDAAWSQLRLLDGTSTAVSATRSLAGAGVGAIFTGSVAAPWEVQAADGSTAGLQRAAGLYLWEDGRAGTVRQVDVVV